MRNSLIGQQGLDIEIDATNRTAGFGAGIGSTKGKLGVNIGGQVGYDEDGNISIKGAEAGINIGGFGGSASIDEDKGIRGSISVAGAKVEIGIAPDGKKTISICYGVPGGEICITAEPTGDEDEPDTPTPTPTPTPGGLPPASQPCGEITVVQLWGDMRTGHPSFGGNYPMDVTFSLHNDWFKQKAASDIAIYEASLSQGIKKTILTRVFTRDDYYPAFNYIKNPVYPTSVAMSNVAYYGKGPFSISVTYSGSQKSEVCPMRYALCPMPYALCPMPMSTSSFARKAICASCLYIRRCHSC